MERIPCPQCGKENLKTDPQCLACGASLLARAAATMPPVAPSPEPAEAPQSFWETPQGQRRIAIGSGIVMLLCLWFLVGGFVAAYLPLVLTIAICAGIWELREWSRERQLNARFEKTQDKAQLQAELARLHRPDRTVQTQHGTVHIKGFDSNLSDDETKK